MRIAHFGHGRIGDLLAQTAPAQRQRRFFAAQAQGIGVGDLRTPGVTLGGEHMPQAFPGIGAGALGEGAVQVILGLAPQRLRAAQAAQRGQQAGAGRVRSQPGFGAAQAFAFAARRQPACSAVA